MCIISASAPLGGHNYSKSSAVAEVGDRLATVDMGRKLSGRSPFVVGAGPHLTQCRLGRGLPPYQVASWSIQSFGHNRHGPKIGGCAPFRGQLCLEQFLSASSSWNNKSGLISYFLLTILKVSVRSLHILRPCNRCKPSCFSLSLQFNPCIPVT